MNLTGKRSSQCFTYQVRAKLMSLLGMPLNVVYHNSGKLVVCRTAGHTAGRQCIKNPGYVSFAQSDAANVLGAALSENEVTINNVLRECRSWGKKKKKNQVFHCSKVNWADLPSKPEVPA